MHWVGHRDDVDQWLSVFDAFVLPSTHEGMSNTLLEAMAAGVAPVVSDVGGNAEIVQHGVQGLVFPSNDESSLASCLIRLKEPAYREQLATAARERAIASFGIDAMIQRYEALYTRVVTTRGSPQ